MLHYEFPLNEGMRTLLRLQALYERLDQLVARDEALDHHHALCTAFEIVDIAARVDLRADLLRDVERLRQSFTILRGHPAVDGPALAGTLTRLGIAHTELQAASGKLHHQIAGDELLMSLKSRIGIPAGTCEFDLPAYRAWQLQPAEERRRRLHAWLLPLRPFGRSVALVVELVRGSGSARQEFARAGQLQVNLGAGKPIALVRVGVAGERPLDAIPEISGHRLMLSIRMMRLESTGALRPCADDVEISLTLCPAP